MASPTLELTGAVVSRLKAEGVADGRIYDNVPTSATFPYVSIGPGDEVEDGFECIDGATITLQLDAWSRAPGYPEVLRLAADVRAALHNYEAVLTDNAFVLLEHRVTRRMRDPDGLTSHAVIELVAIVEVP